MCMRTAWVGGWATTRQCKEEKDDLLRTCAAEDKEKFMVARQQGEKFFKVARG